MASRDVLAEPSVIECAVCYEDFKNPKLLPCSHSYCLECLEQIAVNNKITCPECRGGIDIPPRGVAAFPDNRYVYPVLMSRNTYQCLKHGLPLHFFCEKCQEQICSSCATVKHKGHDVKEIEDKAHQCREDMAKTKDSVRELGLQLGSHLDKLNEAVDMVNKNTSQNLDAIDDRREELHNKIKEMHEMVQAETERQKTDVLQRQRENLQKIQKSKTETLKAKSSFDEMYMDIEKGMKSLSNNEIVQKRGVIEKSFEECKIRVLVNNEFDVKVNNLQFTKHGRNPELKEEEIGTFQDSTSNVRQPDNIKEETVNLTKNMVPAATEVKTFDLELEPWAKTKMCVIRDGHIIIGGKVQNDNLLKCFNANGNCLWQIKMGKASENTSEVRGLCHLPNNTEYFILTKERSIELRHVKDGAVVRKRHVEFLCGGVCETEGAVLVSNFHSEPRKLVQLSVKPDSDECFELTNVTIDTKLKYAFGLDVLNLNGKEIVIVTCWQEDTIEAIDIQTGEIVWKISGEYERKNLKPHGVCHDDIGNLYIADGINYRVLVVSPDGAVTRKLIDTPAGTFWIGWLDSQRLVVDYEDDKVHVNIYKIDYVEKDS